VNQISQASTVAPELMVKKSPVEIGSLSHDLQGFIHVGWLGMGFLNHQQYVFDFGFHLTNGIVRFNCYLWGQSHPTPPLFTFGYLFTLNTWAR